MLLKSSKNYTAAETDLLSVFCVCSYTNRHLIFFFFKSNFDSFNQIHINNQNQILTECLTLLDVICLSYLCYNARTYSNEMHLPLKICYFTML